MRKGVALSSHPLLEGMNCVIEAVAVGHRAVPLTTLRAVSSFHSSPVLERKRRTHWNSGAGSFSSKKFNYYARRMRKFDSKRTLLNNISEYAEYLFQSWREEDEQSSSPPSSSWFKKQYWSKGTRKNGFGLHEPEMGSYRNQRKGGVDFCASDDDVETIFRTSFGGARFYYWSFDNSEYFHSGHANHRSSSSWRYETDDETDTSPQPDVASERQALGLSVSGPLKLEEVKSAYRACALRWHPDRHQGSSKVVAEEKFKHCSAAYQSLCDRLAME